MASTRFRRLRGRLLATAVLFTLIGCAGHKPPNMTPEQTKLWQANEVVVALGTLQHAAIGLNGVNVCAADNPQNCHPIVSDHNTGIVVDNVTSALKTIRAVPDGWNATANAAITQIEQRLDAAGKSSLNPYIEAARAVLNSLLKAPQAPSAQGGAR